MPIKINMTKNDVLAIQFHSVSQKSGEMSIDDQISIAQAVLVASFSSAHSWKTYNAVVSKDMEKIRSFDVRNEFVEAENRNWKHVRNMDIKEVAEIEINDSLFSIWLTFNAEKSKWRIYRDAWNKLKCEFDKECDTAPQIL